MRKLKEMPLFDPLDDLQKEAHSPNKHLRLITGEERKEEGMRKVLEHAAPCYKALLESALMRFPIGRQVTAEDLTAVAGRPPKGTHFNTVGALISGMAKRGLLRKTPLMVKAKRPGMNATELRVWIVVKYS